MIRSGKCIFTIDEASGSIKLPRMALIKELLELRHRLQADLKAIDRVLELSGEKSKSKSGVPSQTIRDVLIEGEGAPNNGHAGIEAVTNDEIRSVVFARVGKFTTSDITTEVRKRHPGKILRDAAVPSIVFGLKKSGKLKEFQTAGGAREYMKT